MSSATTLGPPHQEGHISFRNQKLACVAVLVLVFLSGSLAGVAFYAGIHHRLHRTVPFWSDAGKQISLDKWKTELDLTPAQADEVGSILEDFAKYYRTVTSDAKSRILRVLTDEQKRKFEKMLIQARY